MDRNLATRGDQPAEHGDPEQRLLAQEPWDPAVVPEEVGAGQRIEIGDVVRRDDDSVTLPGNVLSPVPSPPGQRNQGGSENARDQAKRNALSLCRRHLGSHHLPDVQLLVRAAAGYPG